MQDIEAGAKAKHRPSVGTGRCSWRPAGLLDSSFLQLTPHSYGPSAVRVRTPRGSALAVDGFCMQLDRRAEHPIPGSVRGRDHAEVKKLAVFLHSPSQPWCALFSSSAMVYDVPPTCLMVTTPTIKICLHVHNHWHLFTAVVGLFGPYYSAGSLIHLEPSVAWRASGIRYCRMTGAVKPREAYYRLTSLL